MSPGCAVHSALEKSWTRGWSRKPANRENTGVNEQQFGLQKKEALNTASALDIVPSPHLRDKIAFKNYEDIKNPPLHFAGAGRVVGLEVAVGLACKSAAAHLPTHRSRAAATCL